MKRAQTAAILLAAALIGGTAATAQAHGPGMMGQGMGPGMMGQVDNDGDDQAGGYGMGYGRGYGYGMMGPGMMGQGYGYGMGPGMMGPGMMGYGYGMPMMGYGMMGPGMMGPGMMGYGYGMPMMGYGMMGQGYGMGPGMMGYGCPNADQDGAAKTELKTDDVKKMMESRLAFMRNPNLKVGKVAEKDKDTISAEIVTKDGSLVRGFEVNRHTGWMRPVK